MASDLKPFSFGRAYDEATLSKIEQEDGIINTLSHWVKKPENILFFGGNVGTGKTYFAAAFYNDLKEAGVPLRAFNEDYFVKELKSYMNKSWDPTLRIDEICDSHCVIFDDMGCTKESEWKEEMLFHFIDLRFSSGKPTIITSNLGYRDFLEKYHARLASRLFSSKNTIIYSKNSNDRRQTLPK